jgi:hypothetical protein
MKKMILSIAVILLLSCEKDNPQPNNSNLNCDCNRVMEHTKFYILGDAQTGKPGFYYGTYVLINDCSEVQYNGEWNTSYGDKEPINGQCYTK